MSGTSTFNAASGTYKVSGPNVQFTPSSGLGPGGISSGDNGFSLSFNDDKWWMADEISLDGGTTTTGFTVLSLGSFEGTARNSNFWNDYSEYDEGNPPKYVVLELDSGEQFMFFPEDPDIEGDFNGTVFVLEEGIICFGRGSRILTPRGEIPIEDLHAGDSVLTMDSGFQEIRWIGSTKVQGKGNLAPIRIKAGTLGNARDVVVSPQHRILLKGGELEVLFGQNEALVAARHLVNGDTIVMENVAEIEYFHMLFDQHEIVYSEGMPSESFHPGAVGLSGMARRTQREIIELFPQLETDVAAYGASCRQSLKAHEAKIAMQQVMSSGAY